MLPTMSYATWARRYIGEAIQKTGVAIEVGGFCVGCHCLGGAGVKGGSFGHTPCVVAVTCVVAVVPARLCVSLTQSVAGALRADRTPCVFTFMNLYLPLRLAGLHS